MGYGKESNAFSVMVGVHQGYVLGAGGGADEAARARVPGLSSRSPS